ncbi:hypothetical protein HG440_003055 [Candidatus Saccharibacteria bacterium]|nr:hypothetical protein [Candidatus Saccharibacteria bacterium]
MPLPNRLDTMVRRQHAATKTRRTVLVWVAAAGVVLGISLVALGFVVRIGLFHHTVLAHKHATARTIHKNAQALGNLRTNMNLLSTSPDLKKVRSSDSAPGVQTILDAMPADENRLALGASLQKKVFNVPGLTVDALSVDPPGGEASEQPSAGGLGQIAFSASISGTPEVVRQALTRAESSIRPLSIHTMNGVASGQSVTVQLSGVTYYYPPADVSLRVKTIQEAR